MTKSRLFFWDLPNFRAHNSLFVFFKISFPPGSTFIIRYRIIMNYLCNSLSICDMICLVIIPCFFFSHQTDWDLYVDLRFHFQMGDGGAFEMGGGWDFYWFQTFRGWDGETDPFASRCELLVEHVATNSRTTLNI